MNVNGQNLFRPNPYSGTTGTGHRTYNGMTGNGQDPHGQNSFGGMGGGFNTYLEDQNFNFGYPTTYNHNRYTPPFDSLNSTTTNEESDENPVGFDNNPTGFANNPINDTSDTSDESDNEIFFGDENQDTSPHQKREAKQEKETNGLLSQSESTNKKENKTLSETVKIQKPPIQILNDNKNQENEQTQQNNKVTQKKDPKINDHRQNGSFSVRGRAKRGQTTRSANNARKQTVNSKNTEKKDPQENSI